MYGRDSEDTQAGIGSEDEVCPVQQLRVQTEADCADSVPERGPGKGETEIEGA